MSENVSMLGISQIYNQNQSRFEGHTGLGTIDYQSIFDKFMDRKVENSKTDTDGEETTTDTKQQATIADKFRKFFATAKDNLLKPVISSETLENIRDNALKTPISSEILENIRDNALKTPISSETLENVRDNALKTPISSEILENIKDASMQPVINTESMYANLDEE